MGEESASATGFRISSRLLGIIAVTLLFIISLFLWTLPFQKNQLPFGEGDSAWHFAIGDHITSSDHASYRLPYYVGAWYYGFNSLLGPFAPEYPPSNHVDYALMQVLGGGRFIPQFIFRAVASFLGVFAVYFVISRLFGVLPGFIAGLGLSFSIREQLTYLFGQQPTLIALIVVPVAVYAWYKYLESFYEPGNKGGSRAYLFISIALLASQFLLHLQGFVASIVLMAVLTLAMVIRFRKLPFSKTNIVALGIAAVLLAAVAIPFASIYLGTPDTERAALSISVPRLFEWGISPAEVQGSFPPAFVQFSAEYAAPLRIFLFAGIILLLIRLLLIRLFLVKNNTKEIFLLSWLVGAYIVLHLDAFGFGLNRLARMLVLENYIFFSLIALSVVWLPQMLSSVLKLDKRISSAAKYLLAIALIVIVVSTGFTATKARLETAYNGLERITPTQAGFAADYINKLPETAFVYDPILPNVGGFSYTTWRYPKLRWMLAISQRYVGRDNPVDAIKIPGRIADPSQVYVLFDYSDLVLLSSASDPGTKQLGTALAGELSSIETSMFNNTKPVYDVNNIRLYKYIWQNSTNFTVTAQ